MNRSVKTPTDFCLSLARPSPGPRMTRNAPNSVEAILGRWVLSQAGLRRQHALALVGRDDRASQGGSAGTQP